MNFRFTVVETSLNRAEFRWKWLRFLQHSFLLGCILCALVLLFGVAIILGWVTSKALATTFFAVLGIVAFIAWAVIIILVLAGSPDRAWLAAALERVNPRLLDRLNTLLFLEHHRRDARGRLVCQAHRPANRVCAGGESGAHTFPVHPRAWSACWASSWR